jgi:hypothetical protein
MHVPKKESQQQQASFFDNAPSSSFQAIDNINYNNWLLVVACS